MGIIPDAKPEFEIDKTAADELDCRNDAAAEGGAQNEWLVLHGTVEMKNCGQANTSAERHTPMRITSEENLERIVCRAPCCEQAELAQGNTDGLGKRILFFGNRSVHKIPFMSSLFDSFSIYRKKDGKPKKRGNVWGNFFLPPCKITEDLI